MKYHGRFWLGAAVALALCVAFAWVFVTYAQPMEDRMYDLSIVVEDGAVNPYGEVDVAEALGWTVYIRNGDTVIPLSPDGYGAYGELDAPGQTFYFSRVMTEELDAATLQLGAADRNFAVFLDGELIYTDCPEQDNRIGYLTLPMHGWDRTKDLTVSLPEDYVGRTLTIAQSTPEYGETPRMACMAMPCSVKLYCSFAYESALIAESFLSATIGAVGYVTAVIVLIFFVVTLLRQQYDVGLLFLAVTLFLAMSARLYDTSYYIQYFGIPDFISASMMFQRLTPILLLAFLATRAEKLGWLGWVLTGLCAASELVCVTLGPRVVANDGAAYFLVRELPGVLRLLSLLAMLGVSWALRRGSRFHRFFAPASGACLTLFLAVQLFLSRGGKHGVFLRRLTLDGPVYQLTWLLMAAALIIVVIRVARHELRRYAEKHRLLERSEMTRQSYENLRQHNEEVMVIRHDMNRHFQYLRSVIPDGPAAQYLDTLIGQNDRVRPVIQCGNEVLDLVIGSRMAIAGERGVRIELQRTTAPERLALEEKDLCAMMMNLLDNAIEGAANAGVAEPWVRLDLHVKSDFFVCVCENAAATAGAAKEKETVPKHGLGRKIIRHIADKYGVLLQQTQEDGVYRVKLAFQPGDAADHSR